MTSGTDEANTAERSTTFVSLDLPLRRGGTGGGVLRRAGNCETLESLVCSEIAMGLDKSPTVRAPGRPFELAFLGMGGGGFLVKGRIGGGGGTGRFLIDSNVVTLSRTETPVVRRDGRGGNGGAIAT